MELTGYLHPGWAPLIRPAPATRPWMDATPESFAYRCLPLNIANAHGWEVLTPCSFDAIWNGGGGIEAVTIKPGAGSNPERAPVSLFGQGVITFHVEAIFRTPPGWNLWVGGSPNRHKDAIAPLTGIVETDWSPFTFTMNWRFTRPHQWIHFDALEPFCFLFPLQRAAIEAFKPAFAPLGADPATEARFRAWSDAREAFQAKVQREPPVAPAERWQKHYYRGVDVVGETLVDDHHTKLRVKPFDAAATPDVPTPPMEDAPIAPAVIQPQQAELDRLSLALQKREWLLETLERQRSLSPSAVGIERHERLSSEEFLEHYYAANRPVILTGEMVDWPALHLWTPQYLKDKVGARLVEFQGGRSTNPSFEVDKDSHRLEAPFDSFMDQILTREFGNDAYITAYNSERNTSALAPLIEDLGVLDKFLDADTADANGMMWIGPAHTFTPLHHDLTNNLIAQIVGSKRLTILPASEVGRLYNHHHVFSDIADVDADPDLVRYPRLAGARAYQVTLEAGEILFMPLAWWHQVAALDFSVTLTYTNFRWPNDGHVGYPTS